MGNLATAPVAFFAFKRPEHTRRTLAALAANDLAADTDLHIFCDGPRAKADEEAVKQVREICHSATGFASLHVHEHSVNQGLANSLFAGLNCMFENHERVIVFEDDVFASPGTLRFLNACLKRYQSEPVVFNISAWSPDPKKLGLPDAYPWDVYFIPRFHCWGWASWKDRWQSVDRHVPAAPALFDNSYALRAYRQGGEDVPHILRAALAGEVDTWDVQTDFARFKHGRLGLNPVHAYAENIGYDNSGTHCSGEAPQYAVDVSLALAPDAVRFPEYIFVDEAVGEKFQSFFSGGKGSSGGNDARHPYIESLERQLAFYTNSRIVRGALQLRDIAKRRAWRELLGWGWRVVRFVMKKLLNRSAVGPLAPVEQLLAAGDIDAAYAAANSLKRSAPLRGLDALRAEIFLRKEDAPSAVQSLREELRFFPDNDKAVARLYQLESAMKPFTTGNGELDALLPNIAPATMVGPERLRALYEAAVTVCRSGSSGNFVECGVAAGGTSGLLSTALLRYDISKSRRLYSFDTFSGMPASTSNDMHQGIPAQDTGWGEGTCAAPLESLTALLQSLGTAHLVRPVQGLFADTLPQTKDAIGPIALLHMDGDWYASTRDILVNLYDQLVPGAYVQVDDYGHWEGCRKALHDFFAERGIEVQLHPIDGTGVWFHKPPFFTPAPAMHDQDGFCPAARAAAIKRRSGTAVLVNLGCGSRRHPDWINIDFHGDNANVFQHNLREGLPLPAASVDCVYTSHCLEHFTPHDAEQFLRACARILKPSGLLRIVVPDLEQIARAYLTALDGAHAAVGEAEAAAKHEWMVIELVDQLCRHQSGGEMLRLWGQPVVPAEDFIISRVGTEYLNTHMHCKGMELPPSPIDPMQVGAFRLGGEPHQWMYDELSLARLLRRCGFTDMHRAEADISQLDGFARYCLDTNEDGTFYKPDSLYMEALLA